MILPSEKSATDVAAQCFLNALIRETKDWQLAEYPPDELIIPLDEQKSLHFRVAYFSPTQHHRFAFPAHLVTASGSYPVDFTTLSRLIIDKLRHQLFLPVPLCETFHQRVLESYAHTQQTIDARHDWAILREKALNFGEAEQALLTGHAFHPAPKSHEPFNRQEAERYLPDMAPHFPLRWFSVDIYRDCQGSAFMPHATEWLDTIDEAQAENIFTREQLLRYFPYYLLVNSTFAVTAALGAAGLDSEANLMARVRTLLAEVRDQVTHKTCLNYVLESPYWNVKGNFFCYLNDHNENTIVDPSVIYFDFANPLQAQEV
ncbi:hypothetical protein LPD46_004687 [Escherichia coli]|nr:hypothetical protein [Escherichia coli]EIN4244639.1 hypothetical protein [Escherichia coli]EIQ9647823.1 hypothetical protein [Escherichia coli]EIT0985197.1 hypothetical protein [Escherichia coli]HBM9231826.1 hypothetical protein [Escherichia coli]